MNAYGVDGRGARRRSRSSPASTETLVSFTELTGLPPEAERIAAIEPEIASLLESVRDVWDDSLDERPADAARPDELPQDATAWHRTYPPEISRRETDVEGDSPG